eukprot:scaffold9342_cov126-Isochrysis_galbana.AAC.11
MDQGCVRVGRQRVGAVEDLARPVLLRERVALASRVGEPRVPQHVVARLRRREAHAAELLGQATQRLEDAVKAACTWRRRVGRRLSGPVHLNPLGGEPRHRHPGVGAAQPGVLVLRQRREAAGRLWPIRQVEVVHCRRVEPGKHVQRPLPSTPVCRRSAHLYKGLRRTRALQGREGQP